MTKGREHEAQLTRSEYDSDHYFDMYQLCSFAHQIQDIHRLKPSSILEIGIGNGFTSTYLKLRGYNVTTADINPNLGADVVCDMFQLPTALAGRQFDLIVCCEVLEHLPFDEFEKAIAMFGTMSERAYITLPNYRKYFGFSGFFDVPRLRRLFNFGLFLPIPRPIVPVHFWELDYKPECNTKNVLGILNKHYAQVEHQTLELNRYHHRFVCSKNAG